MDEATWLTSGDLPQLLAFVRAKITPRQLRLFAAGCCRRIWHLLDEASRRRIEAAEQFAEGQLLRQPLLDMLLASQDSLLYEHQKSTLRFGIIASFLASTPAECSEEPIAHAARLAASLPMSLGPLLPRNYVQFFSDGPPPGGRAVEEAAGRWRRVRWNRIVRNVSGFLQGGRVGYRQAADSTRVELANANEEYMAEMIARWARMEFDFALQQIQHAPRRHVSREVLSHDLRRAAQTEAVEALGQARLLRDVVGNPFCPVTIDPGEDTTSSVVQLAETIYTDQAFDRLPILADALCDAGYVNAAVLDHCHQPGDHVRGCWVVDLILARNKGAFR